MGTVVPLLVVSVIVVLSIVEDCIASEKATVILSVTALIVALFAGVTD